MEKKFCPITRSVGMCKNCMWAIIETDADPMYVTCSIAEIAIKTLQSETAGRNSQEA